MDHIEVTFRNMQSSQWLEEEIRERTAKLEKFCPTVISCRVFVGVPHRQQDHAADEFEIHIDLVVPGEEIAVSHAPNYRKQAIDGTRKDIRAVVHDAFAAAKRQLQDYVRRHRDDVKAPPHRGEASIV